MKDTVRDLNQLALQIESARGALAILEQKYADLRLEALRTVQTSKRGDTITLTCGQRVIKAKKPARFRDRWNLMENGQRIGTEVPGSIHDIRFRIAMGSI